MSESTNLFKVVLVLGTVFFIVGLLPGFSVPQPWIDFRAGLAGQGFPVFNNPFDAGFSVQLTVVGDSTGAPNYPGEVSGCNAESAGAGFSDCVASEKDSGYAILDGQYTNSYPSNPAPFIGDTGFIVQMTDLATDFPNGPYFVDSVVLVINCQTFGSTAAQIEVHTVASPTTSGWGNEVFTCPVGVFQTERRILTWDAADNPDYRNVWAIFDSGVSGSQDVFIVQNNEEHGSWYADYYASGTTVGVDYFSIEFHVPNSALADECENKGGLDYIACEAGRIGRIIWDGILFVLLGAAWLFSVGVFVLLLVFNLLAGFVLMVAWLYTIPGAPVVVQGFVDVLITALLAWAIYIIIKTIRGTSTI